MAARKREFAHVLVQRVVRRREGILRGVIDDRVISDADDFFFPVLKEQKP